MGGPRWLLAPWFEKVVLVTNLVLNVAFLAKVADFSAGLLTNLRPSRWPLTLARTVPVMAKVADLMVRRLTNHRSSRQPVKFVCMGICVL